MVHQIYGIRYSTPCTPCHIQAFKPLSGSSLQATFGTISMQMFADTPITHPVPAFKDVQVHYYTHRILPPPDAQFDLVHYDIVGPLPSTKDNMYLLTCVHTFALSHTIARHFHSQSYKPFMGWIAQLFGVPKTLMSDRVGVEGNLSQMSATA